MIKIASKIFSFLASLIPTKNIILFHSFPDIADNSYAMCRYLHSCGIDNKYSFVWLIAEYNKKDIFQKNLEKNGIKAILVKRLSFMGLWYYIRARYVFVTHGLFDAIHLRQFPDKVINLWHGMPLKLLGASEKRGIPCSSNSNYVVSTSHLYQKIMAEAFSISIEKVLITGQPRCDLLFEATDWFDSVNIKRNNYRKVGIWLPTYRKSILGDVRVDGDFNDHGVSFLDENELRKLDNYLVSNNLLLLVKIHPMDALQHVNFIDYTNLIFIKPKDFHSQLYPLLGACDFLLTDYSSVFIDYQILHRPMGFVMNDIESYKYSRGFYFDDIVKALPGPILSSFEMICEFIEHPTYVDSEIIYNDFNDNKSSKRIWDYLSSNTE